MALGSVCYVVKKFYAIHQLQQSIIWNYRNSKRKIKRDMYWVACNIVLWYWWHPCQNLIWLLYRYVNCVKRNIKNYEMIKENQWDEEGEFFSERMFKGRKQRDAFTVTSKGNDQICRRLQGRPIFKRFPRLSQWIFYYVPKDKTFFHSCQY